MDPNEVYHDSSRPVPPEDNVELLIALGRSLYGERWQAQFAKDSGIPASQLAGVVKRTLALTPGVKIKIGAMMDEIGLRVFEEAAWRLELVRTATKRFGEVRPTRRPRSNVPTK